MAREAHPALLCFMIASPSDVARNAGPVVRSLPSCDEAERQLLGVCLFDGPDIIAKCIIAGIHSDSFYVSAHQIVYDTLLDLYSRQQPIDQSTVAGELKQKNLLDEVGGYAFLTELTQNTPTSASAAYHLEKVRELALIRGIIRSRTSSVEECYNYSGDMETFLADLTARENRVTATGTAEEEETVEVVAERLLQDLDAPNGKRKGIEGLISWTLIDLDRSCGKLAPGELVVLAGKPGAGKSALADQIAWKAAKDGNTVLLFSYEMTKSSKIIRIAQQISGVNFEQFESSPMDMRLRFTSAVREIRDNKNLRIYERDTSLNRLIARVRSTQQKEKVGLVVVDFLQRLSKLEPSVGKERTDEKIGRISTGLADISKECACPVLLLSALNRDGYKDDMPPTMASLRNSGEIESDADVIGFLHWPKTAPDGSEQDPHDDSKNRFVVSFLQEKGRNRGVHQCQLSFERLATRFQNYCR